MVKSNSDQIYFTAIAITLLIIALVFVVNRASNKVDQLQQEIDTQNQILDSLKATNNTTFLKEEIELLESVSKIVGKLIKNIEAGDILYWNGANAGYELDPLDDIDFEYEASNLDL